MSITKQNLEITGALEENKGLINLDLRYGLRLDDDKWGAIYDSLKTHPTLEVLNLCSTSAPPALIKPRIQALLDMLKVNMSIHTIHVHEHYNQHEFFRRSVVPYLETNRLWPRLLAIQKHDQLRTVPRFWDERFLLYEPIPIAFGCFFREC
jgi:hypothetical protein